MSQYLSLQPGQPAPWFRQRCTSNPDVSSTPSQGATSCWRLFGTARDTVGQSALQFVDQHRAWSNERAAWPSSASAATRRTPRRAGTRIATRCALLLGLRRHRQQSVRVAPGLGRKKTAFRRQWVVLDPGLHVVATFPFVEDGSERTLLARCLEELPPGGTLRSDWRCTRLY